MITKKTVHDIQTVEAGVAAPYWECFKGLPLYWKPSDEDRVPPHWKVITGRLGSMSAGKGSSAAKNPFHAALNYVYGVAEHLLLRAIHVRGLDPACGFLHVDRVKRNSLVFDLIEPHRAEVEAKVLEFFNRTTLRAGDVTFLPNGQVMLNMELLRYLVVFCMPDTKRFAATVNWLVDTLTRS